jgi:hypothetical protein
MILPMYVRLSVHCGILFQNNFMSCEIQHKDVYFWKWGEKKRGGGWLILIQISLIGLKKN